MVRVNPTVTSPEISPQFQATPSLSSTGPAECTLLAAPTPAVTTAAFTGPADQLALLEQVIDDVKAAGVIQTVDATTPADGELRVAVELEPEPAEA